MANQQGNPNQKNRFSGQGNKKPKNREIGINVTKKDLDTKERFFIIGLGIQIFYKDTNEPLKDATIILRNKDNFLTLRKTTDGGYAYLSHPFPIKNHHSSMIEITILVEGHVESASEIIIFPAAPKVKKDHPHGNRVYLTLESYINDNKVAVAARVTDKEGIGIKDAKVNLLYRAKNHYMNVTDDQGNTHLDDPIELQAGENLEITGTVSGILAGEDWDVDSDSATDSVIIQQPGLNNNVKAVLFIGSMLLTWLICLILWTACWKIGWGESLFIDPPHLELSEEEKHYNELMQHYNPEDLIKPEVSKGNWQKVIWYFTFIFTIATFLFSILTLFYCLFIAPSDEIARAMKKLFKRKKKATQSGRVGDSFWERHIDPIITKTKEKIDDKKDSSSSTTNPINTAQPPATPTPAPAKDEKTVNKFLGLDKSIIVAFVIELLVELAAIKIAKGTPKVVRP